MSSALHQNCGPMDDDEAPLLPIHAMALGLAAAAGRKAWTADDMADAALLTVDYRAAGLIVVKGGSAPQDEGHARLLAPLLAAVRRRAVATPRDRADAERIVSEVRSLGFAVVPREG